MSIKAIYSAMKSDASYFEAGMTGRTIFEGKSVQSVQSQVRRFKLDENSPLQRLAKAYRLEFFHENDFYGEPFLVRHFTG